MWIAEPGEVSHRVDFLGTHEMCIHLVRGKHTMIVGGGMSYISPVLERQLSAVRLDGAVMKYLVITHSHFDHCGAIAYLKRKFPEAEVLASSYATEVLSKPKVADVIAAANRNKIGELGLERECRELGAEFDRIMVDRVVADGELLDLGDGIEARVIETPGHSRCSLSLYIPELKAMFPSDSAPCPLSDGSGFTIPSPQHDFAMYLESLRKLCRYEVGICAFEHHGVFEGDQAGNALQQGLERTLRFRNYVMKQFQEIGDAEKVARKLATEVRRRNELPFLSLELQATVLETSVRKMIGS